MEMSTIRDGEGKFTVPKPFCRRERRFSQDEVERLVEGYESGRTVCELGAEFGIHRVTVNRLLKRSGVTLRRLVLSESPQ